MHNPNVFSDQHHLSLYNSLRLLFEGRMGGKLYRPIGKEWFTAGYWRMAEIYNNHPDTIEQYLGIRPDFVPQDGSMPLNRLMKIEKDVYYIYDPEYDYYHKGIELKKFMEMDIDIVIASLPQHIESFQRLCAEHPKHPKFIYQVGNSWGIHEGIAKNIMASAIIPGIPEGTNSIVYHQEFDTNIFKPPAIGAAFPDKNIYSFINCFNTAIHYTGDWRFFQQVEQRMQDWAFRSYGGSCRDGAANGAKELSEKMREARFIWHVKAGGDGYGHVLHNSAATGRPIITKMSYYTGKLGAALMRDGETCINIDDLGIDQVIEKINYYSDPVRYAKMCANVYWNFKKVCDFDAESTLLQSFLDKLL